MEPLKIFFQKLLTHGPGSLPEHPVHLYVDLIHSQKELGIVLFSADIVSVRYSSAIFWWSQLQKRTLIKIKFKNCQL